MIKEHCKWVMEVPVISTSHITEQDAAILAVGGDIEGLLGPVSGGWMMCVEDARWNSGLGVDGTDPALSWSGIGLSPQFCKLMILAESEGFHYLRLDADGCIIPGLPKFEW